MVQAKRNPFTFDSGVLSCGADRVGASGAAAHGALEVIEFHSGQWRVLEQIELLLLR